MPNAYVMKPPVWEDYSYTFPLFSGIHEERWEIAGLIYQVRSLGDRFEWAILGKSGPVACESIDEGKAACIADFERRIEGSFERVDVDELRRDAERDSPELPTAEDRQRILDEIMQVVRSCDMVNRDGGCSCARFIWSQIRAAIDYRDVANQTIRGLESKIASDRKALEAAYFVIHSRSGIRVEDDTPSGAGLRKVVAALNRTPTPQQGADR